MEELPEEDVSEIYLIELSEINGTKAISILNDQSAQHMFTSLDIFN